MRLVFDIETNGLLKELTKIWMLVFYDIDTHKEYIFCDDALAASDALSADVSSMNIRPTMDFIGFINEAAYSEDGLELIGHFILGFDLAAIEKVTGYVIPDVVTLKDTMIMSQVQNYKRFGMRGHSLALWGEFFHKKKPEHEDWMNYSPEMLHRCREDVGINVLAYNFLIKELLSLVKTRPLLPRSIRIEHDVLRFCNRAEVYGWLFDKDAALDLLAEIETRMLEIEEYIEPQLAVKTKIIDKEEKWPKWLKNGHYDAHTARYFGIPPENGLEEWPLVLGPYQRFEYVKPDLGTLESVKELLDRLGWEPDDWNWKKGPSGEPIKGAPKLTTTSLLPLGPIGEMLDKYYTLRSRHQIVKGWVENLDENNRLHGGCFTIATPTGRARHSGLVNVPSADGDAMYGKEIRSLFITKPGYKIVGADSSGNQMRAFCHYLKNDAYTKEVIDGDVHTANMLVLQEVVPTTTRKRAKPFLYAFLFGGGSEKLALILVDKRVASIGKKAKAIFMEKTPGLKELVKRIDGIVKQTGANGEPWIPAIDGRRVFVDSPHKALNYLLQSCEAVTCKAAVAMFMSRMKKELPHVPWEPLIFYHDEFEVECPEEFANQVSVIMQECFRDAPKEFGVMIMDGASKVGNNWYDVH